MNLLRISLSDLIEIVKTGDNDAETELVRRFDGTIVKTAAEFKESIRNEELDDLIQKGRIKLLEVAKAFDSEKGKAFPAYFKIALKNLYKDIIRQEDGNKSKAITDGISLDNVDNADGEDDDQSLIEKIPSNQLSPEDLLIKQEADAAFYQLLDSLLSDIDLSIMRLYLEGITYQEIAQKLNVSEKKVDNAIYNAKKKYLKYMRYLKSLSEKFKP